MVEEFMLPANITVARDDARLPEVCRCSAATRRRRRCRSTASRARWRSTATPSTRRRRRATASLDVVDGSDPYLNKLARILATRWRAAALLFGAVATDEYFHRRLAAPIRTTSPRRSGGTPTRCATGCSQRSSVAGGAVDARPRRMGRPDK